MPVLASSAPVCMSNNLVSSAPNVPVMFVGAPVKLEPLPTPSVVRPVVR